MYLQKTEPQLGSFDNAPDVLTICFLSVPCNPKSCLCDSVNDVIGLKSRARTIPPLNFTPPTCAANRPDNQTHQPHLINTSRRRYTHYAQPLRMSEHAMLFPFARMAPFLAMRVVYLRPGTRARLRSNPRRPPCRHAHGGTGAFSAHMPRRSLLAMCSRRAKCNSFFAYALYHQAHPARIITADTSRPSGSNTWQTFRPYLSPSRRRTTNGTPAHKSRKNALEPLNAICPCSGASIPQSRTRRTLPPCRRTSRVSPSKHCTNQPCSLMKGNLHAR